MWDGTLTTDRFDGLLQPLGLTLLGSVPVAAGDGLADLEGGTPVRRLLLVGNGGPSLWPVFSRSPEFGDGRADPLDRWSRRVGDELAALLGGRAIFPFDGPPFPPFLSWAGRTGAAAPSRLSLYMHRRFGLWHAYRFALALPGLQAWPQAAGVFESPCLECAGQPCLGSCPVNAFAGSWFRSDLCMEYLAGDAQSDCRRLGCGSRRACPVGRAFAYHPRQAKFHLDAFVKSGSGA